MKSGLVVVAIATLLGAVLAPGDEVSARSRDAASYKNYKSKARCADRPLNFSWRLLWDSPEPRPNGCAPPVFVGGQFVGQDPDPLIRLQLMRDPHTGYRPFY